MKFFKSAVYYSSLLFFVALCLGNQVSQGPDSEKENNVLFEKLDLFATVLSLVQNSYVEQVSSKDLIYGALQGTLASLDPFSQFLTPDMYKEMQIDTGGKFGGLGIEVVIQGNTIVVVEPLPNSPAEKAGLKPGDRLIRIHGEPIDPNALEEAVSKLRGPVGSKIDVTLFRPASKQTFTVEMMRENIKVQAITQCQVLPGTEIGYIKLPKFQEDTSEEFSKSVDQLLEKKIKGLILDLRNNPGGLLDEAIDVAGRFIGPEKLVVYTQGRLAEQNVKKISTNGCKGLGLPAVLLINRWTASAAEVVSGAVQDWEGGLILGETSFGKASVQSVIPLKDGSALRLTTAKYYTPKGRLIHQKGIEPDLKVDLTDEDLIALSERMEKARTGDSDKSIVYKDFQILKSMEIIDSWNTSFQKILKDKKATLSSQEK